MAETHKKEIKNTNFICKESNVLGTKWIEKKKTHLSKFQKEKILSISLKVKL
jgi:hypothetical protein